jgi:PAS domain S-box-containing protein
MELATLRPMTPPAADATRPPVEKEARLRLLNDLTASLNLGRSVEEIFDLVYSRLQPLVPYHRMAIAVTDEKRQKLAIIAVRSDGKMVLGKGYAGEIAGSSLAPLLREGRVRILNDLQDYLQRKPQSESTRLIVREGMRSSLTLPLVVQGEPVGVMFFSNRAAQAYRPEHEEILRAIVGHVAIAVERTRLLDTLRERTEYLESLLQNSADAIIVEDREGRIRTWNEGARRMYGFAAEEIVGGPLERLVPRDLLDSGELDRLRARVEAEAFVKDYETARLTRDGRRIAVNLTSTLMRSRQGRIVGRSIIERDVTHVKRLQQELINSQSLAAVGELAATVAHEIKNPLAGISGAIQVLREAIPAESGRREIVTEILAQIARLDNTVRDLLTYSRPATPVRQEVELGEMLVRPWALLSQQDGAGQVRFTVEGAEGIRVPVDPSLFQQVWLNLYQNAVEAMPKGGELSVRVRGAGPVEVEVRDSGSGIEAGHLAKMFRPFFSTKTRGTGLGLAITKKIVEAHGGSIRVESEPKKGTSVRVEIPR